MKRVLVLGAGLVSRPLMRYLLRQTEYRLLVASDDPARAEAQMGEHPRGRAVRLDAREEAALEPLVAEADVVVSLLPAELNAVVARVAIRQRKPMVNTSYVTNEMRELDEEARAAGVLLLCEMGLDPGIDHMAAVSTLRRIHHGGGRVVRFLSACGGFPAQDANTNPWGYKFSWSPKATISAMLQPARWLVAGEELQVGAGEAVSRSWPLHLDEQGLFEVYPNRDSLRYRDAYGAWDTHSFFRGTVRYPGWCGAMDVARRLGFFETAVEEWPEGTTYRSFAARRVPGLDGPDLIERIAELVGMPVDSHRLSSLEWAGFFSDRPVPERRAAPIEIFGNRLFKLMPYRPGERDLVLLEHVCDVEYPDGGREQVRTRLVQTGDPWGDTAMARTVSLTAAIGVRLLLERGIHAVGVQVPTLREVYEPVLDELAAQGIELTEHHVADVRGPFDG
ncbi:MAG TPA: saccharopine dehydrogenase C-terminal domain-containing protein [Thermoanaerobaculia bacterium]|nr:saccharopine dehydrogenase C-terminal domain-containing protein [Thermoanaerobaculia bacterium]